MDLNGIGELLSKEQMKMVTGGDGYSNYITCYYNHTIYATNQTEFLHFGHNFVNESSCDTFCAVREPASTPFVDYWEYWACTIA